MANGARTCVVILGGGFGGIYAALRLEKALARGAALGVTLVDHESFVLVTPMLHEVAASALDMTHVVNPIRTLRRRVKFIQGGVEAIDLHARRVVVSHGGDGHRHEDLVQFRTLRAPTMSRAEPPPASAAAGNGA